MGKSLRSQISLYIMTIVLVVVALVSFLANAAVNRQFEAYMINQERGRREKIINDLENLYNAMTRSWDLDYIHAIGMYSLYDGYVLTVYDSDGKMIWDAASHDMALCKQIMGDITERMSQRNNNGFTTYSYDLLQGDRRVGTASIQSYGPYFLKENEFQFVNDLSEAFLVIGLLSCVVSILTGTILAHRIARPITKTAEIAQQISNGDYNIRLENETNTRELNMLLSSISHMADSLSRQEQHRKQLTADVAHELRTPLTALRSHLEAMAEGLWEPTAERLNGCVEEVKRLSSLVVDLDGLAKLEQDIFQLKKTESNLLEIVQNVSRNFEKEADNKQIRILVEGAPSSILLDKDRIVQVITNLLSNAIKYTPEGGQIKVQVKDEVTRGIVMIEDNGIGIPQKDLPYIFERFYRTDQSRNRKTGGAGIGLTIAKSIIEAHKGKITVDSNEGAGSKFTVLIPK
ncbi:Adaptive-response sensory-kinase SasA [anaerobic digester metagenome]